MNQYRKSPRAQFLDYNGGTYFVTICTRDRKNYFGDISNNEMQYRDLGLFCCRQFEDVSSFCANIEIVVYTVMPNHVHAIIKVGTDDITPYSEVDIFQRAPNPYFRPNSDSERTVPLLSRYISSFKGAVSKYAKSLGGDFGWQSRYYDHLIRGACDWDKIYDYIINNVSRWETDCLR